MNLKFKSLNLKKYLPFFKQSAECACALGLINNEGCINMLTHEGNPNEFGPLLKHIRTHDFNNSGYSPSSQSILHFGSDGTFAKVPLTLPHYERPCWLTGMLKPPAPGIDCAQQAQILNTLVNIADCIAEDYTTQITLIGMSDELIVRYEELNLIYGLDDSEMAHHTFDERQAIDHLIKNCINHLNVDFAALYAPEFDLMLNRDNNTDIDIPETIQLVQNSLFRFIVSTMKTLVVNQNQDIDWTDGCLNTTHKIIATPIILKTDQISGILVLINTKDKPDFSNSDRKLSEVLASEAAKLIQARRDNITGLFNRRGFTEKMQKAITLIKTSQKKYSILFIDIDQFKIINDTSGQKAGDQLLNQIGSLLTSELSRNHSIGRLGADEYGILLENSDLDNAKKTAEILIQKINQFRFAYNDKLFAISVCIGVSEILPDSIDFSTSLNSADLACQVAKEQGRNRLHLYHSSDEESIRHQSEMHWVSRINQALVEERFQIYRQKILPLQTRPGAENHYEILLRLKDENGNIILPNAFIPAAERYLLMSQLDRWVIKKTLAEMERSSQKEPESKISYSINLSGQSFCESGFVEFVIEQINQSGITPNRICFEVTETAAVSNLSQTIKFMEKLKNIGCTFSLDDFGSGMSSFTYLKNLPVDYLKIDGYFVKNMLTNSIDYAMVKSINEIGHVMKMKTIAEFVENDLIMQELTNMGIDYGQGYAIGKPGIFE